MAALQSTPLLATAALGAGIGVGIGGLLYWVFSSREAERAKKYEQTIDAEIKAKVASAVLKSASVPAPSVALKTFPPVGKPEKQVCSLSMRLGKSRSCSQ
jgi:hypothetical protein